MNVPLLVAVLVTGGMLAAIVVLAFQVGLV